MPGQFLMPASVSRNCCAVALGPARLNASWIKKIVSHGVACSRSADILSLWASHTTQQLPYITFIFCHGGGVLPILLGRFAGFSGWAMVGAEQLATIFPAGVYAEFAKFYFELAQAYAPETIALLRAILPETHLLYGSDYSYFPISHSADLFGALDLSDELRVKIAGENAATLLARPVSR